MASSTLKVAADSDRDAAEALTRLGITRVPVDYFHYKSFRYTNLDDAVAQANRDSSRSKGGSS